jgi:hypothetical protein
LRAALRAEIDATGRESLIAQTSLPSSHPTTEFVASHAIHERPTIAGKLIANAVEIPVISRAYRDLCTSLGEVAR